MDNQNFLDVKCILASKPNGASTAELKREFREIVGIPLQMSDDKLDEFLQSRKEIETIIDNRNFEYRYVYHSVETQHIQKLNRLSRTKMGRNCPYQRSSLPPPTISTDVSRQSVFFSDNQRYVNRKYQIPKQRPAKRNETAATNNNAYLSNYEFVGDDFLLSVKNFELGQPFEKRTTARKIGLCISGQTIRMATYNVQKHNFQGKNKKVIINIGSVDLLQGHSLVRIFTDIEELHNQLELKGLEPIWTTLAPLVNQLYKPDSVNMLNDINAFLRNRFFNVLDLHQVMVDENNSALFSCYQPTPRRVSGSSLPHVFWNKIGRQRILKAIEIGLGQIYLQSLYQRSMRYN